ncbi:MAG: transposase [Bacteroidota bacterium]|nr:MAG: transposase [Bacteroidota bacterium]
MKLIAQVKLQPEPGQTELLRLTLETANAAANYVSEVAWETKTFRQYDLHRACYYTVRERYELSAQMTVRMIAKVADAYKLDRKYQRRFHPHGSIAYDERILTWKLSAQTVSIWTVAGRQTIPFVAGERQLALLLSMQGEADLVYRRGEFYLYQTCEVEEPPADDVDEFLGVDLGIVNIATDSDGETYSGAAIEECRRKFAHRRRNLQRKGTRAARHKLRQLSGKQRRFQADSNHSISKRLVQKAQGTGRGIALEDLAGIRGRLRLRRKQRARHANWAFHDLRAKIEYKARLSGVLVVTIDPHNTSRECPACGYTDKANRPSQSVFSCVSCGYSAPADTVAAWNIRARAAVSQPNEPCAQGSASG